MRWLTSTLPAPTAAGRLSGHERAGRRDDVDGTKRAAVGGDGRVDRGAEREGNRRHGDGLDGVDVAAGLRVRAGEVEGDLVAGERDRDDDPGRALLVRRRAGGVEDVLEPPAAVGEGGQHRSHAALAVGDDLVDGRVRRARPAAARRPRWRRAGRRGRRRAPRACGMRPAGGRAARRCSGSAGCGGPPARCRSRRPAWSRARRRPTSAWCARLAAQPTRRSPANAGVTTVMSLRWVPPGEGVVHHHVVAGSEPAGEGVDGGSHRRGHRAEVHRDVLGLREQLAGGGEDRRRAVGPLLDVRARRGAPQHGAHLVGDPTEPGDQHLQRGGVERHERSRRSTRAPAAPGSAVQPAGIQIVQSGSASATGPTADGRSGAGRSVRADA